MHPEHALIEDNVTVLTQALDLLRRVDCETYASAEGLPARSGAGAHVRHCLDFYRCLLAGLASGRVDYDERQRDPRVASDPHYAAARIAETVARLRAMPAPPAGTRLLVRPEESHGALAWGDSSLARELQFLLSHTIHHFAIVALLLRLRGVEPGEEFGVAPSTLEYWRNAS